MVVDLSECLCSNNRRSAHIRRTIEQLSFYFVRAEMIYFLFFVSVITRTMMLPTIMYSQTTSAIPIETPTANMQND